MGSRQNTGLALLRQINRFGFVANEREETIYQNYRKKLDIRSVTSSAKVGTLSGGNQQKIVLAKWLATKPKLLILDEPARGIEVGAKRPRCIPSFLTWLSRDSRCSSSHLKCLRSWGSVTGF
jgi:ABC-type sugar transport system ATPase subunit